MSNEITICTEHLSKRFKTRLAVDDLSLEVRRGEIFGFLGPNGAGKTTTIAMLLGLIRPSSGRALLFGHDVQQNPVAALQRVGAMIEAPAFFPYLSGRDNLRVLARASNLPETHVQAALAAVELEQRARDRFSSYSQGMKQRLAIAATLLADPQLIILDEPSNGLDPAGMVEIRTLIHSLAEGGRTIFLCSHMLHEVEQVCQRVAILKQGRMIAQGTVAELLRRGQGVQVRIAGDAARAAAVLRTVPWISAIDQRDDLLLIDAPSSRTADINAILTRQDILVAEIRAQEGNLETFFLEITAATATDDKAIH